MGGDDRDRSGQAEVPAESGRAGLSRRLASLRHGMPYQNRPAEWAYTLGLLSILFCVGIPCGVAAVVYGILGLKRAAAVPQAGGKVRAWAGIVLGAVFALIYMVIAAALALDRLF